MNTYEWTIFVFLILFFLLVYDDKKVVRFFMIFVVLFAMFSINILSTVELKHPLGIEKVPYGEVLEVLAIDTTNPSYINMMTLDGEKQIYTYAIDKKYLKKIPKQGESINLVSTDNKDVIIVLK